MQVKVQTVSELTINQLSEDQYKTEKAAGRINAGEVYACTPSPVKWEDIQDKPNVSGGGSVDYQELARRIPSWQWKVTMPKTTRQIVAATVNGQTYTDDFYAPQGSKVKFSVSAAGGYNAGTLSLEYVTLKEDTAVTVTEATEIPASASGTKTFGADLPTGYEEFRVPPNVQVLKFTWGGEDIYVKVKPQSYIGITINKVDNKYEVKDDPYVYLYDGDVPEIIEDGDERYTELYAFNIFYGQSSEPLTVSWSTEINNHSTTEDWTQPK